MHRKRVAVLNYGSGNVASVFHAVSVLGHDVIITNKDSVLDECTHYILPGVGAFGEARRKVHTALSIDKICRDVKERGKPLLGICVGMQLLADRGFEYGEHEGLGLISGDVIKLEPEGLIVPHIGWNSITYASDNPLFQGLGDVNDFYFVHGYMFREQSKNNVIAKTEYGIEFTSAIQKDNIYGVQFHPEKSQRAGQVILNNFVGLE